ncbi:MAG: ATP--guanido phosphotransferase, partial [Planctomycetota bacterium]
MKLTDISNDINEWFDGSGPLIDIIMSSRIRLARNLAGYKFLNRCSVAEKTEILNRLRDVITSRDLGDKVFYVSVNDAPIL